MEKNANMQDPKELCVPIYLNQKIVFDLLAVQENGFSQLATLKTSNSDSETNKYGMGASIGVSNVFALLGVSFSGDRGKEKGSKEQSEISQEKVHTPTSLFAKFRSNMIGHKILHQDLMETKIQNIKSGDFVEFKAVLHQNPIVDFLSWIKAFTEMVTPFIQETKQTKSSGQSKAQSQVIDKKMIKQIDTILAMLTSGDSIELVGDLLEAQGIKAVISCQKEFFNRGDPSEIIDGEFYVLGKVVQVANKENESINLLRKTPLGRLDTSMFTEMSSSLSDLKESGFKKVNIDTVVNAPAILVIPIAIFI